VTIPRKIRPPFDQPVSIVIRRLLWHQGQIAVGSLVAAFGFVLFQIPFKLGAGGVSGLGIIWSHFIPIPIGMTILALNLPLMILGYFHLGRWRSVSRWWGITDRLVSTTLTTTSVISSA
jgi:uncharacterized membrane-anchored protein YitT (DUF2179 family)